MCTQHMPLDIPKSWYTHIKVHITYGCTKSEKLMWRKDLLKISTISFGIESEIKL